MNKKGFSSPVRLRALAVPYASGLRRKDMTYALMTCKPTGLRSLLDTLPAGNHLVLPGDYADPETISAGERLIEAEWGKLHVLVNCAGVLKKPIPRSGPRAVEEDIRYEANGALRMTKLAAKFMSGEGRIIHVTSIHSQQAEKGASSYAMAKAAIDQYCRALALELAERNILVNAIAPGFVNTNMSIVDGQNELDSQWFRDNYVTYDHLPLKRAAGPEEIAGVALFLAGADASYITGQVITVDGGLTITF